MQLGSSWRHCGWTAAAVLASAGLFFVSTGLQPVGVLTWLAPLPVLALAFRSPWKTAAIAALAAHALGGLNMLAYLLRLVPAGLAVAFILLPAVAFAGSVMLARHAVERSRSWLAAFVFPVAWTAYEFLLSLGSPHGTAGSLAYSQMDLLPVIQVASLLGMSGITFVLTLVPSSLAVAWHLRLQRIQAAAALAAGLVPLLMTLGFGWIRLAGSDGAKSFRVGLAVSDRTVGSFRTQERAEAIAVVRAYARRVGELAARGAEVVVLPEKFVGVTPAYAEEVYRMLGEAARRHSVVVVAGLNRIGESPNRNLAVVFSPDGSRLEYDKVHLVPGWEDRYHPGNRLGIVRIGGLCTGVAICKDMDFPAHTRRYAEAGVRVLFVPAWDFGEDAWLHSRNAVLRGVEGGLSVARTAQEGSLTVSDACGRIRIERSSAGEEEVLSVARMPRGPGATLYGRWGDGFAWLSVAALGVILAWVALTAMRRLRSAGTTPR